MTALREKLARALFEQWVEHALDMVIDAKPSFDTLPARVGWGWHWCRRGKPSLFIRRTKRGYSATADRSTA